MHGGHVLSLYLQISATFLSSMVKLSPSQSSGGLHCKIFYFNSSEFRMINLQDPTKIWLHRAIFLGQ